MSLLNGSPKTLIVVDGNNLLCSHASFNVASMADAAFKNVMDSIFYIDPDFGTDESRCDCLFVWDPMRPRKDAVQPLYGFRHKVLPEYKGNRVTRSSVIVHAMENRGVLMDRLSDIGIPSLVQAGMEADDYIAFIARLVSPRPVIIISQDGDFLQMVSPQVSIFRDQGWLDNDNFVEEIGLSPSQFLAWKALAGDPGDNIPGIRSRQKSWLWAVAGADVASLSPLEQIDYYKNLSLVKLTMWETKGAVRTQYWRKAKERLAEFIRVDVAWL